MAAATIGSATAAGIADERKPAPGTDEKPPKATLESLRRYTGDLKGASTPAVAASVSASSSAALKISTPSETVSDLSSLQELSIRLTPMLREADRLYREALNIAVGCRGAEYRKKIEAKRAARYAIVTSITGFNRSTREGLAPAQSAQGMLNALAVLVIESLQNSEICPAKSDMQKNLYAIGSVIQASAHVDGLAAAVAEAAPQPSCFSWWNRRPAVTAVDATTPLMR